MALAWQTVAWGAEATAHADRVRGLNNSLLRLHSELRRTTLGDRDVQRIQAAEIIEQRAAALSALMQQDPGQALSLSFSPDMLAELAARFPQSAASLESHGGWQGPIEYYIEDDFEHKTHRSVRRMRVGDESVEIHFAGPEPAGLQSGDVLAVNGVRIGSEVAVSEAAITTSQSVAAAACSTTGVQNTAVLLVNFPGWVPPPTLTPQSVQDTFFGTAGRSLDGYWREASYGKTSAAGDVFGWYTLSSAYTCSTMDQARDEAIAKAVAAGANFQNYTRIFVIFPNVGCTAGFAQVGCSALSTPSGSITASTSYIAADYMAGNQGVELATHEGGHNLGLQHAGTLGFGTEVLGPVGAAGTVAEFGDYWSTMSQNLGIYPAQQKAEILNWMTSDTNYQVVQSSGTWSLQPLETSPPGLQALKIQRGTGNNAWLWVEYRQPIGNYDSTLMTQPFSGALIHYEDPTTGAFTHLLDFTPNLSWDTWWYPALVAGQTWVDPYTNLSLTINSATPSALTVTATYGATPCTPANPTVSASPLNPSTRAGGSVGYNVTVTNNDSTGCAPSTFSLSSSQPSGWPTVFSTTALTLSPGQSGSVTMTKNAPASVLAGVYAVNTTATAATLTGSGLANVTVTTTPVVTVGVSIPSSTFAVRQTVSITARVLYGSNPARASVKFTLVEPGGSIATKTVTADSTGKAVWSYRIGSRGPLGIYSVTAAATYNAQSATSDSASFTVN